MSPKLAKRLMILCLHNFYDVDTDANRMYCSTYEHSGKVRHTKGNVADLPSLTNIINCERAERQWKGKITADAFPPIHRC